MLSALSFGSIYPRLKQLELSGLIESQLVEGEGRQKKVYELTAGGWQALAEWLEQSVAYPGPVRDELLLKMLYWGATGKDRPTLIAHLRQRRDESEETLRYLEMWRRDGKSFIDEYVLLVFNCLTSRLQADLTWIDEAITQLEGPPSLPEQDPQWFAVLQRARRRKAFGLDPSQGEISE